MLCIIATSRIWIFTSLTSFNDHFTNYSKLSSLEPKGKGDPESYRLELPFDIKSLHPLDRDKYLVEAQEQGNEQTNNQTIYRTPDAGNLFILKKDSSDDVIPTVLNPISQHTAAMSQDSAATVEYLDKSVSNVMEFRWVVLFFNVITTNMENEMR